MATIKKSGAKATVAKSIVVEDGRSFQDSCKEVLTVEEFCAQQGVGNISIRLNHTKINEKTGQPNLFMTWGAGATGAVALKVQQNFHEHQEGPSRPLIGLFETESGEDVYTLFDQGNGAEEAFSLSI